jgi:ABC-type transport system involved in multi-copper enzyme maturation permease subunit
MTALLASEVRRMTSRRLFRVVVALAVFGIAVAAVIVAVRSNGTIGATGDRRFHLTFLSSVLGGISPLMIIGAWLLGASFIGADWHAGTVATLMIWEPRRLRVMVAKLLACVAVVFLLVILFQVLLAGALTLVATLRGTTEGVGSVWVRRTVGIAIRVAALSAVGAAIGFAIASVARNTAAALGVGFGYTVIVENLIRGLRPQWQRWLIGDNAVVFITGHSADASFERTVLQAGLFVATYAAAMLIIALALFRGRDVN